MYDIITFGSAAQDIYFTSKNFLPAYGKKFITGEGVCLNLGSKTEMESVFFSSGGGGTNVAATFANLGLKVAYCGQVGRDYFGDSILKELKGLKIDASLVRQTQEKPTNISVILSCPGKGRTALVYRGASDFLEKKDIPWDKLKNAGWFYLAPFSGKLAKLTKDLVEFANKNKIKVAFNPGYNQLALPGKILEGILDKIDILILNKEEASLLTMTPYQKEKEIFRKIDKMTKKIVIMTKGGEGVVVSDGKYLYHAKSLSEICNLKIIDSTGAGDAFGSGFVTGVIQKNDIVYAIQLAMANSGYNLTKWGAKEGLLRKGQNFKKITVIKEKCLVNGLCQPKIKS